MKLSTRTVTSTASTALRATRSLMAHSIQTAGADQRRPALHRRRADGRAVILLAPPHVHQRLEAVLWQPLKPPLGAWVHGNDRSAFRGQRPVYPRRVGAGRLCASRV